MNYKLIKFKVDGNCLTPCPYGLKGVGRIMVYSASCNECKHNKGKVKKHVKCSFEYDSQEPDEIKTGKVTSSEEVKSCATCLYGGYGISNNMVCFECKGTNYSLWTPKVANEKPKIEKVKKYKCNICSNKCKLKINTIYKLNPNICPIYVTNIAKWELKEKHNAN
jgi:hypothetical protein